MLVVAGQSKELMYTAQEPLLFIDIASWILSLVEAPSQCRNQLGDVSPSGHVFVDKLIKFSVSHPIQQKTIFVMNM